MVALTYAMEDIFQWCREGIAMQVRVWLDDTEHDMNQGWVKCSTHVAVVRWAECFHPLLFLRFQGRSRIQSVALGRQRGPSEDRWDAGAEGRPYQFYEPWWWHTSAFGRSSWSPRNRSSGLCLVFLLPLHISMFDIKMLYNS